MPDTTELSEAKRALIEKYLRGDVKQFTAETSTIIRRLPGSAVPLSLGQQQLWLLAQLMPESPVYNEGVTIHLPGLLDVAIFEQSFNEIIKRHEAWRTSFPMVDGHPVQIIHPTLKIPLPVVDLQHLPETAREAEALRLASEEAKRPFDIAGGPLLRASLVRLADEEHRLFLTLHHIIFDGFSLYQVFLPELYAIYEAFSNGRPSPLPELPVQYADFAVWQRERLEGNMLADQIAYWKKQLNGTPTTLELPVDHPRPPFPTYRGAIHRFALPKRLADDLKALSRQEGVSLYMMMVAALQTLLHRYSGQHDVPIGTVISDRRPREVQKLVGFFLNTLVLRTDLSGNPTFRELLGRVSEVILEAHAHQEVPFEYLVKELQPQRQLGQNPLFQVMLTLEPPLFVLPSGWTMTQMDVKTDAAKFDLFLELDDRPESLIGHFEYSTDLFDATTIERMACHWQTLLEGIVAHPEWRLSELPLLTETERRQLLVEWNDTASDYPRGRCLHQLFEAQVERTPEAVAVVSKDERLTYRELNSKANRLAHHLQRLGVGPEVPVGICVGRSLEMMIAILGVLKAGGAYVPLDPAYPRDRLAFMLHDAQVPVLLTQQYLVERIPQQSANLICLDTHWKVICQECDENPTGRATSENLAYIIYTSGSTGQPKGVAIEHRSTVAFTHWALSVFTAEDLAGVLASTSICFDLSVFEIFVPLSSGGTVILVENLLQLPSMSTDRPVTLLNTVPSAMTELLRGGDLPTSIHTVNLAGETLHSALSQRLFQQDTLRRVFNLYGPTEDTTYSTFAPVEKGEREQTIGRPIANTQVYILDSHFQQVPIGVAGELYIGGEGLARGYLNRPELTAERFIPDPFSQWPNGRLYKTGDLARYLPDGNIQFLGRTDHQVKMRGFRIELGEIEEVLGQHPEVREAVVVAREDTPGDKRLVAYIVAAEGRTPTVKNLRSFLEEKLPGYMVPPVLVLLDALPLSPNGKVDRHALLEMEPARRMTEETYVAPTAVEHYQLIKIWEELLDVRPIGIRDNFFLLGGHSLLAARLVNRIEQVFGKKIPLATLFARPTIEHLVNALQWQDDTASWSPILAIQSGESKRPFFFLHGVYDGGAFYCFPLARALGPDQPFYALQPYRFDGLPVPPSLEAMAAAHIQSLRAVQPEGPYLLGGFCNGGLVSYEMARQLHAQGETVNLLALMDPTPVGYLRSVHRAIRCCGDLLRIGQEKQLDWYLWLRHMYRYLWHLHKYLRSPHYRRLKAELDLERVRSSGSAVQAWSDLYGLRKSLGLERSKSGEQIEPGGRHSRAALALTSLHAIFPDPIFPPAKALRRDNPALFYWATADYVPDYCPGKSTFFFFSDREGHRRREDWRKVAEAKDQEVEVHIIAGTHATSKTEHLHDLANCLRTCLSKAQATKPS